MGTGGALVIRLAIDPDSVRQMAEVARWLATFEGGLELVAVRAVSRTAKSAVSYANQALREVLTLRAKDIKPLITVTKYPSGEDLTAEITVSDAARPLYDFSVSPKLPVAEGGRRAKQGPSVRVRRGGARQTLRGAFVARMQSGHLGVFRRPGQARLPVKELYSAGIASYWQEGKEVHASWEKRTLERLGIELDQQLDAYLVHGIGR